MANNKINFLLTMGEDVTLLMTARTKTGAVLDLTGCTIVWRMGRNLGDVAALTKSGAIASASLGTFTVSLSDGDTDPTLYKQRNYRHQAIVTSGAGVTTVAVQGVVRFDGQIVSS